MCQLKSKYSKPCTALSLNSLRKKSSTRARTGGWKMRQPGAGHSQRASEITLYSALKLRIKWRFSKVFTNSPKSIFMGMPGGLWGAITAGRRTRTSGSRKYKTTSMNRWENWECQISHPFGGRIQKCRILTSLQEQARLLILGSKETKVKLILTIETIVT